MSRDLAFAFDIQGAGGGQWSCRWKPGGHLEVSRGLDAQAAVTYRTDAPTFAALVRNQQTPQEVFFAGRVEIAGDVETGLKLAALFERFLAEAPYETPQHTEVLHAALQP
jgi:predicted lipid carrier protein YhbT